MTREISNSDDVIDSREVIARIEELEAERAALVDALDEANEEAKASLTKFSASLEIESATLLAPFRAQGALKQWDEENGAELAALKSLADEAEHYAEDWEHGATLIRDSNFTDYCEELVKDIGDLPNDIPGYLAIDWETTAENLKVDYSSVEFDGVTYWIR